MDLDRYMIANQNSWNRLSHLTEIARKSPKNLKTHERTELMNLYQKTATQLSYIKTHFKDPALVSQLTEKVAKANSVIYHQNTNFAKSVSDFFTTHFPAAVWQLRYYILTSAALLLIPWIAGGYWLGANPDLIETYFGVSNGDQQSLVAEEFEAYYSTGAAEGFFSVIALNNIAVSLYALAGGILLGLGTVFILLTNGVNIGVALGIFIDANEQSKFWRLILPHGLLEITAIIVAGGAGLALGWALLKPGEKTRSQAFSDQAQRCITIVLGLSTCFLLAALIEAYVTPSILPDAVRIVIGLLALFAYLYYWTIYGRKANQAGYTGLISEISDTRAYNVAS